jgi:preprotein translocase subunit SecE
VATTVVVLITSFVFAVYLWGADFLIQRGYVGIVKVFAR